jgi:putative DNA primase/helicase
MTDNHIHNGDIGISMSRVTAAEGSPPATLSNSEQKRQGPSVVLVRASEIVPESVRWIWPGIIAKGKVTGLAGHPGLGKSQVALDVAATVSTGRRWPGGLDNENAGDVIILSAEDDAADTVVPRLIAAGADRTRMHIVTAVKEEDGGERAFNLTLDLDRLEKENDLRAVRLLVIDPVSAYLGSTKGGRVDRNRAGDVRSILGRLAAFAARQDLGVVAISHLNKSGGRRAIARIMGSQEWVAAPRAVFLVAEEVGTGRRLFLPLKNNLGPDRTGYAFELEDKIVANGIRTSAVVWSGDHVTISTDGALAAAAKNVKSGAINFLQRVLSEGPMDQAEIVRLAKEAGLSQKNLRTAREKLGITPRKEGFGASGKWVWVPAGGATVLKLVVNNEAKTPADKKEAHGGADDIGRNVDRQKSRGVAPTGQTGMMWPNKASGSVTS